MSHIAPPFLNHFKKSLLLDHEFLGGASAAIDHHGAEIDAFLEVGDRKGHLTIVGVQVLTQHFLTQQVVDYCAESAVEAVVKVDQRRGRVRISLAHRHGVRVVSNTFARLVEHDINSHQELCCDSLADSFTTNTLKAPRAGTPGCLELLDAEQPRRKKKNKTLPAFLQPKSFSEPLLP